MLSMESASGKDLERIEQLYSRCIRHLDENGIFQWNGDYPNRRTYENAVETETQYLFIYDDELVGAVVLNCEQAEEWTSAAWNTDGGNILVIHGLVIDPGFQGRGFGRKALGLCEDFALKHDFSGIRLDAFSENPGALHLYESSGYRKTGAVSFDYKPEGHQLYFCYEKKLSGAV